MAIPFFEHDGRMQPGPARVALSVLVLGSLVLVTLSPRGTTAVAGLVAAVLFMGLSLRHIPLGWAWRIPHELWPLSAFAALAALSSIWSPVPADTATKAAILALAVLLTVVGWRKIHSSSASTWRLAAPALLWSGIVVVGLTAFESITDQWLARLVYTLAPAWRDPKHVELMNGVVIAVSAAEINRRTAVCVLLLWPLLLLARSRPTPESRLANVVLAGCAGSLLVGSTHQSSQLGLLAGAAASAAAIVSWRGTIAIAQVTWSVLALAILPLVLLAQAAGLEHNSKLFASARHRVVIWTYTATQVSKSPILGIGADATAFLHGQRSARGEIKSSPSGYQEATSRHAHNVFLQVWYEMGAVGALSFCAAGLGVIRLLSRVPVCFRLHSAAHVACVVGLVSFSYSLWQIWMLAAIALSTLVLGLAIALDRTHAKL